jgi:hypothetical protein
MDNAEYNNTVMKRDHCHRLLEEQCSFLFEILVYCLACNLCSTELIDRFEIWAYSGSE